MKPAISAIILAAGSSRRMGEVNKLLVQWRGMEVVRHVVETVGASGFAETVVVTGHDRDAVEAVLAGARVRFVHNPRFGEGLSTSLAAGIGAVGGDGAAVLLGDMPALRAETLKRLISAFVESGGLSICAPVCDGRRGNPVVWPKEFFSEIMKLSGDRGARDLLARFSDRVRTVACRDRGVLIDIDRPGDLPLSLANNSAGAD